MNERNHIPLKKAISIITLSVFCVFISFAACFLYFKRIQEKQRTNPAYHIVAIMQAVSGSDELKTIYLAEMLGLSVDQPKNLYAFDLKEGKKKLLALPIIKDAFLKKIFPGTLQVNYQLRTPIAFLGEYTNTAIDRDRIVFPFKPFYTPKKLPEIYLGEENESNRNETSSLIAWGTQLNDKYVVLAFELLDLINEQCLKEQLSLRTIDVSKAFALSCGQRQIVIVFEDCIEKIIDGHLILCIYPDILRLSIENYRAQLANYLVLRKEVRKRDSQLISKFKEPIVHAKATVIDLRLSDLAFINSE